MYRAVVLTTLVLLMLAVAGVSVAQEDRIFADGSNSDDSPGSAAPEKASFGATVAEDPETTSAPPSASSKPEDGEDTPEATVVTEPTVEETEEPTVGPRSSSRRLPLARTTSVSRRTAAGTSASPPTTPGIPAVASPKSVGTKESLGAASASKRSPSATKARTPSRSAPRRRRPIYVMAIASERADRDSTIRSRPEVDYRCPRLGLMHPSASSRSYSGARKYRSMCGSLRT